MSDISLSSEQYKLRRMYCLPLYDASFHPDLYGQENHWLSDRSPCFFLWLNAVWTVDCSIKRQNPFLARPIRSVLSRLGSIPHNILVGVPFRSLWVGLESCQETSILHCGFHRLVSLHWNSLETVDYSSFTASHPLHLCTDDCQNVKNNGSRWKRG